MKVISYLERRAQDAICWECLKRLFGNAGNLQGMPTGKGWRIMRIPAMVSAGTSPLGFLIAPGIFLNSFFQAYAQKKIYPLNICLIHGIGDEDEVMRYFQKFIADRI